MRSITIFQTRSELFVFCLNDYWAKRHNAERTLPFREVAVGETSPGQVFKFPEATVRERLETIEKDSIGLFSFQESSALSQVVRGRQAQPRSLLRRVYNQNH